MLSVSQSNCSFSAFTSEVDTKAYHSSTFEPTVTFSRTCYQWTWSSRCHFQWLGTHCALRSKFMFLLAFLHVLNKFLVWSEFAYLVTLIDFFLISSFSSTFSHLHLLIKFFCSRYHQCNRYGYLMRENMLCAGEEGKDSCSGKLHSLFKEKREAGAKCEHVKIFRYSRNSWKVFVQSQKKVIWAHFSSS